MAIVVNSDDTRLFAEQPLHDVAWIAWNRQVQHILASSQAGSCVVWDLRKNEPIIKIRDSMSHVSVFHSMYSTSLDREYSIEETNGKRDTKDTRTDTRGILPSFLLKGNSRLK